MAHLERLTPRIPACLTGMFIAVAALLSACGGGGGGGGGGSSGGGGEDTSILAGSWYGVYEDTFGTLGRISVTVSSSGTFNFTVSGGTANDGSGGGTIRHVANSTWATDVAGSAGGFMADKDAPFTVSYAGFVDDEFNFAVLQRGASSLPSYTTADINGSWNGSGVYLTGSNLAIAQMFGVSLGVSYPSFSGSDTAAGGFTGSFTATSLANGGFAGTVTQSAVTSDIEVFLSADKQFAGFWACDQAGSVFPDDCSFGIVK